MVNTKDKNNFSKVVILTTIALLLFMPNFTYCFSKIIKTLYSYNPKILTTDISKELLEPKGLKILTEDLENINKNIFYKNKPFWIALIFNSLQKINSSNLQLESTENNLKPPENFKIILIYHYIIKCFDLQNN